MKELRLLPGLSAQERGRVHGETFREDIHQLAEIRRGLACAEWLKVGEGEARAVAERHLPLLAAYDEDLYQEFQGIAQAANISQADLLILNNYTDFRDLGLNRSSLEEGCTILQARYDEEVLIGQTWDMHASAEPFVIMMFFPDEAVWVQTVTGCLALCGLNRDGLAVTINNLVMKDAQVGVSWPTLVRKMLRTSTTQEAESVLLSTKVGSGHHYLVGDRHRSVAWEIGASRKAKLFDGAYGTYVHANHCLDSEMEALSRISATSTTTHRQGQGQELLAKKPQPTAKELWDILGCRQNFPYCLFTNRSSVDNPHGVATCARVLFDCKRGEVWARAAFDQDQLPIVYCFDS